MLTRSSNGTWPSGDRLLGLRGRGDRRAHRPARSRPARPARRPRVEFNRDIRPILSENCYACHGPDKNKRKAKLRLDDRASAVELAGDRSRQARRERAGRARPERRRRAGHAPAGQPQDAHARPEGPAQAVDRPGGGVPGPLGLRAAAASPDPHGQERGLGPQPDRRVHPRARSNPRGSPHRPRPTGGP